MITIELTEQDVQTINIYRKRFKQAYEQLEKQKFKTRLPESIRLEKAFNSICRQAEEKGVKLE